MKSLLTALLVMAVSVAAIAQIKTTENMEKKLAAERTDADTAKLVGWHVKSVAGAGLSQASYSNWVAGGQNSIAWTVNGLTQAVYYGGKSKWTNTLNLRFGQTHLEDEETRKTDDEIYFESLFTYAAWPPFSPYAAVTLRTQFAPGYNYPADAPRVQVSKFFDPAYLTESVGILYQPAPIFFSRLGIAAQEVFTSDYRFYADPLGIDKTRFDVGLEWISGLNWEFLPNMIYVSRLELFAPFDAMDMVIVRWDNVLAAKVNDYISVNLGLQLLNDVNVSPRTQMKQSLIVALSYTLL